jgi:hypothetical protein
VPGDPDPAWVAERHALGKGTKMADQLWQFRAFPPDGEQDAVVFLNAAPRQGPGEASGFVRNDGSAVVFYLEPGSG